MLGHPPFTEETPPNDVFNYTNQAFRTRAIDYLGGDGSHIIPILMRLDLQSIEPAEQIVDSQQGDTTEKHKNNPEALSLPSPIPFVETIQLSYGIDYDCLPTDPQYAKEELFRYFVEVTFGVPLTIESIPQNELAKAIGTLVIEYAEEFNNAFAEQDIDLEEERVYEVGVKYPRESLDVYHTIMKNCGDDVVELREVRGIRYELSEREHTIRKTVSRSFEVGAATTLMSSITEIDGAICDEESAIPQHIQESADNTAHDTELDDLFAAIMSTGLGDDALRARVTYEYASEIWALLLATYNPHATLLKES